MPKLRYAVAGAGHIAQQAVLPAFRNAGNSTLAALVSSDPVKREELAGLYGVPAYGYDRFEHCLRENRIDAVYIALPNHLHREYSVRAARAGVHVLCEKPMAPTERECREMIEAARESGVKLMIAYRLHFEEGNLEAIRITQAGELGEPRIFNSVFTQQVVEDNIRVSYGIEQGGGPVFDMGVYCINAARYLFRDEPREVVAVKAGRSQPRFRYSEEMTAALLRFPGERLASFTCSFGAAPVSVYTVTGDRGSLEVQPAYEYKMPITHRLTIEGKTSERTFDQRDQFAPELIHFSDCILGDREPEPDGMEGLADVRIIQAIYRSLETGAPVGIDPVERRRRPGLEQEIRKPPVKPPEKVRVESPSGRK
ncbi:MAG: Gfo/Idh/MocA family oxidoreductase [Bryobacterales bacterium]|nr:Gfo/Idh/MocA family oxidoreductase [Bryobacterales bacterium]